MNANCFAYHTRKGRAECSCLTEMICHNEPCKFFKTKARAREDKQKSYDRRTKRGMTPTEQDFADGLVR